LTAGIGLDLAVATTGILQAQYTARPVSAPACGNATAHDSMKHSSVQSGYFGPEKRTLGSTSDLPRMPLRSKPPHGRPRPLHRLGLRGRAARPVQPHTSAILQRLHDELPAEHFTLRWLLAELPGRSFGIIMLILAVVAIAPGVCIVAGVLLLILAGQIIWGRSAPFFPRFITARQLPTRYLAAVMARAVPVLRRIERVIHPRWSAVLVPMRRIAAGIVILLCTLMVLAPIPFVSVVPAVSVALIALAYLEEDGLLLAVALLTALIVLAMGSFAVWGVIDSARWLHGR
jgi:hypothetical protein